MAIAPGEIAPEFSTKNQDGKTVTLSQFKGKPVLLYFYPKDDTPGCTKEACEFRDSYSELQSHGAVILGISKQDEASHRQFKAKYHLPFDLLVDGDGTIAQAYGVGTVPLLGFFKRQSVLIGPDGRVIRQYPSVDPAQHAHEVLEELKKLERRSGS